jgi:hypothetical protein
VFPILRLVKEEEEEEESCGGGGGELWRLWRRIAADRCQGIDLTAAILRVESLLAGVLAF